MMKRTVKARTLAWLLAAGMIFMMLLGETARAASHTYYINYGSVVIRQNADDASKLDVVQDGISSETIDASDEIVITQNNTGTTYNIIAVNSGTANITLEQVNMIKDAPSINISPGAAVYLTLSGANKITSLLNLYGAVFRVPEGAALTIDKKTSDALDSLTIAKTDSYEHRGAGIGGSYQQSCGTVTINGGTVNVSFRTIIGAGIGGGEGGTGGNITINGGIVTAEVKNNGDGAGIGGGSSGSGGTVTINGGIVTAAVKGYGAGIGGGLRGNGGTVIITGGTVTATGGNPSSTGALAAAGIGGGGGTSTSPGGAGGTVTITGGTVTANGGTGAADIGGSAGAADNGTLIIDIPLPDIITDAGYGGSISGSGPYTVTAADGYAIDSLKVDGVLVSAAAGQSTYEVTDAEKSVIATFAYTVNFTEPENGSLTVSSADGDLTSGQIIRGGQALEITAEPNAGYKLESLTVNGEDVTADYNESYTYTVGTRGSYRSIAADKDTGTQGAQLEARFVSLPAVVSVTAPAAVIGVKNGTVKTAAALGLPATVTLVTDDGNVQADVAWDVESSDYDPGSTAAQAFTVYGIAALPCGVINPNGVSLNVSVDVTVNAAPSADKILVSVTAPAAITGMTNGTAKTAAALGLPAHVTLVTDDGNVQADVAWDVASSAYKPSVKTEQTFTVNGIVAMPGGVVNPNVVSLNISVTVSVLAAVVPTPTPSPTPTATPTAAPAATPTAKPTAAPSSTPTAKPTTVASSTPTAAPSLTPTAVPTAITPSPSASPSASGVPAQTASPEDDFTISPEVIEQDEDTGNIVVEIDVDELPEGATAIRLPDGEIVSIEDAVDGKLRLEISEDDLNADGALKITILNDEDIALGTYRIPVMDSGGQLVIPDTGYSNHSFWLWIFIGIGVLMMGMLTVFIFLKKKQII